jgi:DNA-directed RNA polymerase subunit RPC12/RpoP
MSKVQYYCDACGADFDVDPKDPRYQYGIFCPECGESEIIKPLSEDTCCIQDTTSGKQVKR